MNFAYPNPNFTAERIKTIRNRLGLTQAEFGARLGITQKAVSAWEINGLPKQYGVLVKLIELERKVAKRKRTPGRTRTGQESLDS